ncbi:MAG: hypothetical protein E6I33_11485 [Chloroflexi bacterium]|nr:MAG: hypothetical protein E6I33_11485 [Chloroflexota bacterium]
MPDAPDVPHRLPDCGAHVHDRDSIYYLPLVLRRAQVTLLTRVDCCLCDQAKDVVDRVRADYDLQVRLVDIDSAEWQEIALAAGALIPPAVLLDGQPFSVGGRLSEGKLRQQLDAGLMPATRPGKRRWRWFSKSACADEQH